MVTGPIAAFLEGLSLLSEQTGVGIHTDGLAALDIGGERLDFTAECRADGTFTYALDLTPEETT